MPKYKKITIVFDIDGVLVDEYNHHIYDRNTRSFINKTSAIIRAAGYEYFLFPGVIPLLQFLIEQPHVDIAFFSAGTKERNTEFVKKLLIRSAGMEKYQRIRNNISIFSREDLVSNDRLDAKKMYETHGLTWGNFKKDIRKVLRDGALLENAIFIDDDSSYVHYGQEANFLHSRSVDILHIDYDKINAINPINKIYFVSGVLCYVLQAIHYHEKLTDVLLPLQYTYFERANRHELNYGLSRLEIFYRLGVQCLQIVSKNTKLIQEFDPRNNRIVYESTPNRFAISHYLPENLNEESFFSLSAHKSTCVIEDQHSAKCFEVVNDAAILRVLHKLNTSQTWSQLLENRLMLTDKYICNDQESYCIGEKTAMQKYEYHSHSLFFQLSSAACCGFTTTVLPEAIGDALLITRYINEKNASKIKNILHVLLTSAMMSYFSETSLDACLLWTFGFMFATYLMHTTFLFAGFSEKNANITTSSISFFASSGKQLLSLENGLCVLANVAASKIGLFAEKYTLQRFSKKNDLLMKTATIF